MPKPPILWNRLGSAAQLGASVVGEDLSIDSGTPLYSAVKFGDGMSCTDESDSYAIDAIVTMPQTGFNASEGCIEFWLKVNVVTGTQLIIDNLNLTTGANTYFFGNGSTLEWVFGGRQVLVASAYTTGTYHIALVWNGSGIDGGSDTLRIYKDGVDIGSTTDSLTHTWDTSGSMRVGLAWDDAIGGADRALRGYIDNIKVYDYAKTNFSDRFNERGGMNDIITAV